MSKKTSFGPLPELLNFTNAGPSTHRKPANFKRNLFTTKQINKPRFPRIEVDLESDFSEGDAHADSEGVADEVEVKRMVGGLKSGLKQRSNRLRKVHENIEEARRFRREWNARRRDAMMGVEDDTIETSNRNEDEVDIPYAVDEDEEMMSAAELQSSPLQPSTNHSTRRARTVDPSSEKRKGAQLNIH